MFYYKSAHKQQLSLPEMLYNGKWEKTEGTRLKERQEEHG